MYRKTIPILAAADLRAAGVGLVGCGRGDKPPRRDDYTYQAHINWTWAAIEEIGLDAITVVDQDQTGVGLLGLRLVGEHPDRPDRYAGVVAAETYPPTTDRLPSDAFTVWQR